MGRKRELIVTTTFEPNRLEDQNLGDAYEFVLPIRQTVSRKQERIHPKQAEESATQLGIFLVKTEEKRRFAL